MPRAKAMVGVLFAAADAIIATAAAALQFMVLALENWGATSDMGKWSIVNRSKGCKRVNAVCTTSWVACPCSGLHA